MLPQFLHCWVSTKSHALACPPKCVHDNFDQLARELIKDASEDVEELGANEDPPLIPLTICLPLQAIHSTLQEMPPTWSATTKIPLKSLFIFPENLDATSELAYFWKGGIQNLEKEMTVHEILCSNKYLEHVGEGEEVVCYVFTRHWTHLSVLSYLPISQSHFPYHMQITSDCLVYISYPLSPQSPIHLCTI